MTTTSIANSDFNMQSDEDMKRGTIDSRAKISFQNAISPISWLPCEVFTSVLDMALHDSEHPDSHEIIPFTHVCRSWREMAIGDPLLWTTLFIENNTRLHPSVILRSKSAPICLEAEVFPGQGLRSNLVGFISTNFYRVQELHIALRSSRSSAKSSFIQAFNNPAPLLRNASLHNYTNEVLPCFDRLLNEHCNSLQSLTLHSWLVDWEKLDVSHLTELFLTKGPWSGANTSPVSIPVLRRMSNLQVLFSHRAILQCPPNYPREMTTPDKIHFPYLRDLNLSNLSVMECAFFMNLINFPSVMPKITLSIIPQEPSDLPPFIQAGSHLTVVWTPVELHFVTSSITIKLEHENIKMVSHFRVALQAFGMTNGFKSLALSTSHEWPINRPIWSTVLPLFEDLTRLELEVDHCGRNLLAVLTASDQQILPKLRELILGMDGRGMNEDVRTVRRMLRHRCKIGRKVSELSVLVKGGEELLREELNTVVSLVDIVHWI